MKKLFVSDLDGTLLEPIVGQFIISDENVEMIKKYHNLGGKFVVATSRGLSNYQDLKRILGFDLDYICSNGSVIRYQDNTVEESNINFNIYQEVDKYFKKNDIDATIIITNKKGIFYRSNSTKYPFNYENDIRMRKKLIDKAKDTDLYEYNVNDSATKMTVLLNPDIQEETKMNLRKLFGHAYEIVSSDVDLLDITLKGCSKGSSVTKVAKRYNIDFDDIVVIGDGDNDIAMFKNAKLSYAMNNAHPNVKKEASKTVNKVYEALEEIIEKDH